MTAESEAVVAAALKAHRIEHWIATRSYVCGCKEIPPHLTLDEAMTHQAQAVLWALTEWVSQPTEAK